MNCHYQGHKLSNQTGKPRVTATSSTAAVRPKPKVVSTATIPKPSISTTRNSQSMIKKLKWSDFKGKVPEGSYWLAYTYWNYSYSYKVVKTSDPNKVKIQLQARCDLGPKSWVRSPHADLLSHEQGHYDLACLCMLNFKKRVVEQEFDKNTYKGDIVMIYKDVAKEFRDKQIQYDEETQHYLNEEEQARWDKYISDELNTLSVYEFMDITRS